MSEEKKNFALDGEGKDGISGAISGLKAMFSDPRFAMAMKKAQRSKLHSELKYPIKVDTIRVKPVLRENKQFQTDEKVGKFVAVRPVGGTVTYLGIYLGDLPQQTLVSFDPDENDLSVGTYDNPAMFVPELKKIIWGSGSWWSTIEKKEDLKNITDADIESTWYVQALKSFEKKEAGH